MKNLQTIIMKDQNERAAYLLGKIYQHGIGTNIVRDQHWATTWMNVA